LESASAPHPDASVKINVTVRKGQRKPPGYDAAEKAGDFNDRAFMHSETEDGEAISTPASNEAVPCAMSGSRMLEWGDDVVSFPS
jgi:hypothetical protein